MSKENENPKGDFEVGGKAVFVGYAPNSLAEDQEPIFEEGDVVVLMDNYMLDEEYKGFTAHKDGDETITDVVFFSEITQHLSDDAVASGDVEDHQEAESEKQTRKATAKKDTKTTKKSGVKIEDKIEDKKTTKKTSKKAETKKSDTKKAGAKTTKPKQTEMEVYKPSSDVDELVQQAGDAHLAAIALVRRESENEFTLGGVLDYIKNNKVHTNYGYADSLGGFKDYCSNELNVDYRKAQYLVNIYRGMTQLGFNEHDYADNIASIGWSKVVVLLDSDSAMESKEAFLHAAEDAKDKTREELKEGLGVSKITTSKKTVGGTEVEYQTYRLKVIKDHAGVIDQAFAHVREQMQDPNAELGEVLTVLCENYLTIIDSNSMDQEDLEAYASSMLGRDIKIVDALNDEEHEAEVA